jgi:glutathione S-transferase
VALRFYYGSGSPYAWRVWLALEHKGIPYEFKLLSFSGGDLNAPDYVSINPRRKVPAIVDDGFALYESQAIVEYLEERHPDTPTLFPGDVRQRALVRRLVQEADQYFIVAMDPLLQEVLFRPRERWDDAAIAAAREGFAREVALWDDLVRGDWLAGEALSAADMALYPHVALALRLDRRKPDLDIRALFGPRISAWMRRFEALPYFGATIPPHWKS